MSDETDREAITKWALLHGTAQLVPVPFLDDWLAERARREVTQAALRLGGNARRADTVAPLYADEAWLVGCLLFPLKLLLKLVILPIRKLLQSVFFVLGVRAVTLDIGRALFLARAVERAASRGVLDAQLDPQTAAQRARAVRQAYDDAFRSFDWTVLRHAIEQSIGGLGGLLRDGRRLASALARRLRRGEDSAMSAQDERTIGEASGSVGRVLAADPARFADFDRRFDEALSRRLSPG